MPDHCIQIKSYLNTYYPTYMRTLKIAIAALSLAAFPLVLSASEACKKCCGDNCAACCKDKGKACGKDCCKGE